MAMADSTRSSTSVTCAERHPPARGWTERARRWVAVAAVAAAPLAGLGCERNAATPFLVPTGIRPALTNPAGTVFGVLHYDPTQRADLAAPPYPPTRLELRR